LFHFDLVGEPDNPPPKGFSIISNDYTNVSELFCSVHDSSPETPYSSDFEPSTSRAIQRVSSHSTKQPALKDSGSDLSSSILDSERCTSAKSNSPPLRAPSLTVRSSSHHSAIPTLPSVTHSEHSGSIQEEFTNSEVSKQETLSSFKENIVLMPPDLRTNKFEPGANNVYQKNQEMKQINTDRVHQNKAEIPIRHVAENANGRDVSHRQIVDPFQTLLDAEFNVLDNLQQNLAKFIENEKQKHKFPMKNERGVNTDVTQNQDHSVQTSIVSEYDNIIQKPDSIDNSSSTIKTDFKNDSNIPESIHSDSGQKSTNSLPDVSTHRSSKVPSLNESIHELSQRISPESFKDDLVQKSRMPIQLSESLKGGDSESTAGISLQMLNRMMKDEELRSEHHLALIQLRQNALVEKTRAQLAVLDEEKRELKEREGTFLNLW